MLLGRKSIFKVVETVEERIEPTTEFDDWVMNGLDKAEEIIHKSDTENIKR